jgi:hypothetical protein
MRMLESQVGRKVGKKGEKGKKRKGDKIGRKLIVYEKHRQLNREHCQEKMKQSVFTEYSE